MRRGTTPIHSFVLPFDVEAVQAVQIIYRQRGDNVLILDKDDCTLSGNTISVQLTQQDTFGFIEAENVEIQVRVLTSDGSALASDVIRVSCEQCLTEDVL